MTAKRRRWLAQLTREGLLDTLGWCCVDCGATENLTFDCKEPCGDFHHRMNPYDRMKFYWFQHTHHGNVQVLCHDCNSKKDA